MTADDLASISGWFTRYCRSFYTGEADYDRNIALKEEHTARVRENAVLIAEAEGLPRSEALLAEAAGLLHDVGRFEQYRRFRTFRDADSVSHGALGAGVLEENGVLAFLPSDIRKSLLRCVTLHNVFSMPERLDPGSLLLLRIVRDADKLDIWRVFLEFFSQPREERASAALLGFPEEEAVSAEVVAAVQEERMVDLSTVRSAEDFKLLQLSWVFDLNFAVSLHLFAQREYLQSYRRSLPDTAEVRRALAAVERRVAGA